MDVTSISQEDALRLCEDEDESFEKTRFPVTGRKVQKSVACLANTQGGTFVIGIKDKNEEHDANRRWKGAESIDDFNSVFQAIHELHPVPKYAHQYLLSDGFPGHVLRIDVPKSENVHVCPNGKVYVRRGAQCIDTSKERPRTLKETMRLADEQMEYSNKMKKCAEDLTRCNKKGDFGVALSNQEGRECAVRVFDATRDDPAAIQVLYADGVIGYKKIAPEELRRYHRQFFPNYEAFPERMIDLAVPECKNLYYVISHEGHRLYVLRTTLDDCQDTEKQVAIEARMKAILTSIQKTIITLYKLTPEEIEKLSTPPL